MTQYSVYKHVQFVNKKLTHQGSATAMWHFDDIEVEGLPLKLNGKSVTAEEVKKMSGQSFQLEAGNNTIDFTDDLTGLQLTLNGTLTQQLRGAVHLNLSEMACCIGDKCLMWPPAPPKTTSSAGYTISDVEVEDVSLKIDGKPVTPEDLKKYGGKSFVLHVNDHQVAFNPLPDNFVTLTLNDKATTKLSGNLHLNFSPMAVCIGDKCLPWPAAQKQQAPVASFGGDKFDFSAEPSTKVKFDAFSPEPSSKVKFDPFGEAPSGGAWKISDLEVEDGIQLKVDGKNVTADQVKGLAGKPFTLYAGKNHVTFEDAVTGGVSLRLNSGAKPVATITEPLHLNLSSMAVCIGDKCLMWPALPAGHVDPIIDTPKTVVSTSHSTLSVATAGATDASFLESLKGKIGEVDYKRLLHIINPSSISAAAAPAHGDGSVKHADTKEEWDKFIAEAGNRPTIVDCSAVWCKPCKKIAPDFAKIAKQYAKEGAFLGVDVQVNPYVKGLYTVEALPCFLFLKQGKEVGRIVGDSLDDLRNGISQFILSDGKSIGATGQSTTVQAEVPKRKEYDYIVIGGGSGGMASAKEAAKHGAHVALFDFVKPSTQKTKWGLGGTCVNVGCVPKKLMHHAALIGESIHEDAGAYGWEVGSVKHNWNTLVETVQDHVKKLNFFYEKGKENAKSGKEEKEMEKEEGLKSANLKDLRSGESVAVSSGTVTYFNALGKLVDKNTVEYNNPDTKESGKITGKYILICTGGRPNVPSNVPGALDLSITSDDLFSLSHTPGRVLCVGAGYISLECGGFLRGLGYPVTVAVRSVPLRTGGFDRQCVDKLVNLMELTGTRFLMQTDIRSLRKTEKGTIIVKFYKTNPATTAPASEWEEEFDTVLYATGRGADTEKLNLAAVGVKTTSRGTIVADEADRTNVDGIFALGDVAEGRPELTPVAIKAGELLARRLFAGSKTLMDYHNVPTTVFTPFEYGIVGYSEEAAIEKFGKENVEVFLSEFSSLEIGAAHRHAHPPAGIPVPEEFPTNSLSKLVCLKSENLRIVGAHFVGPNAGEILQALAVCVRLKATKKDFDDTVGIHPTDAESFTSLYATKSSGEQWEQAGGCGGGKCG